MHESSNLILRNSGLENMCTYWIKEEPDAWGALAGTGKYTQGWMTPPGVHPAGSWGLQGERKSVLLC